MTSENTESSLGIHGSFIVAEEPDSMSNHYIFTFPNTHNRLPSGQKKIVKGNCRAMVNLLNVVQQARDHCNQFITAKMQCAGKSEMNKSNSNTSFTDEPPTKKQKVKAN